MLQKKIVVEEPEAKMKFHSGQFARAPFSLAQKNIYLVGMRGSGKSTLGLALAERLTGVFVDTDTQFTEESGQSIAAVVKSLGWDEFRRMEEACVANIAAGGHIVALGGGAVLSARNRQIFDERGIVFYLAADLGLLQHRLEQDARYEQRPAFTDLPLGEELAKILLEREPLYMGCMHHMLQAHRVVSELVDDVLVALGLQDWDFSEKGRILDRL